jgi:hypothetical protein
VGLYIACRGNTEHEAGQAEGLILHESHDRAPAAPLTKLVHGSMVGRDGPLTRMIVRAMGRMLQHWRCFWRWPPGHKWEQVSEAGLTYRRCTNCGMTEGGGGGGGSPGDPHDRYRTGGDVHAAG